MSLIQNAALSLVFIAAMIPVGVVALAPLSLEGQMVLGVFAVGAIICLKPFAHRIEARLLLLSTALLLVLRYLNWRIQYTMPEAGLSLDFAAASFLLMLELYTVSVFLLNAFINADPIVRDAPPLLSRHDLPTVDILVPSYNEPPEMLAFTLAAAKNIEYPKELLRVILCDDGGTDARCNHDDPEIAQASRERRATLQKLCEDLGVDYQTRALNERAKAGNLSAALENAQGEIVVIFDADHVPTRDFLANTVGYFAADPELALVQTPHFFINKEPIERNLGLSERCPPENEMFYGAIHRGLDRWGGAFFCGSAALLRRSALDDVGGFAGATITEDAETTVELHAKGWKSLYVDRAMIAGLQPETFASLVQQRGRWATGMLQILLLKHPLTRRGLTFAQRMCYLNSMSFWLFPVIRLGFLFAPLLYLFFGLEVFVTDLESALAFAGAYLAAVLLVQNALFSHVRWPLISEVYELAQAPYLTQAVFKTIVSPKGAAFKVTAKDETLSEDYLSPIFLPLLVVFGCTAAGIVALVARWIAFPEDHSILLFVGGWAVFNFVTCALALAAIAERRQRRTAPRVTVSTPVTLWMDDDRDQSMEGVLFDASMSGARIDLDLTGRMQRTQAQRLARGGVLVFKPHLPHVPEMEHEVYCAIREVSNSPRRLVLGLVYEREQPIPARETATYLIFGESARWAEIRQKTRGGRGVLAGIAYVAIRALATLPSTLALLAREPARRARMAATEARHSERVDLAAFRDALDDGDASIHLGDATSPSKASAG